MVKDLKAWIKHVVEVRPQMDELAKGLESYGPRVNPEETNTTNLLPYRASFQFGAVVTTIRFNLKDWQSYSDVVVTNMTTLPSTECRKGYGSKAVQLLIAWAKDNNLNEVRATQIGCKENESFWQKNGFVKCPPPNQFNDFVLVLSDVSVPT